jgi:molybdopterin-guanine dinucleotide biosynthesis protein B
MKNERDLPKKKQLVFAISGYKNSGKTTLIIRTLPILRSMGYRLAVIKHDGHDFCGDVPGTDSYRMKEAGAYGTAVFSDHRYLVQKEQEKPQISQLLRAFPEADIVLLEGMKDSDFPKYVCHVPPEDNISPEELAQHLHTLYQSIEQEEIEWERGAEAF